MRLRPKGNVGQSAVLTMPPRWMVNPTGRQQVPTLTYFNCGTWKPRTPLAHAKTWASGRAARLFERRAGLGCRKKRRPRCNGADTGCNITGRESEPTSDGSFSARESDEPPAGENADGGALRGTWCALCFRRMGRHRLAPRRAAGTAAADAYRAGRERGESGQGEGLAASPRPQLRREVVGGTSRCREQGKTFSRCRRRSLEDIGREMACGTVAEGSRVQAAAPPKDLHSEEEWQAATVEHTDDDRSSDAGPLPACPEPGRGGPSRSQLVWVPALSLDGRRTWTVLLRLRKEELAHGRFDADIRSCFDRISHTWLLANIPMDKAILRKWLAAGYVEATVLYPTEEGTPQGGIISPILANLTLDGLERVAHAAAPGRLGRSQVNVVRYADDFLITARTPELLNERIIPAVKTFLAERGLELSEEKSKVTDIETGFDFLGATLRKYGGKLLMKPSRASVKGFLGSIRRAIRAHAGGTLRELLRLLNPRIRGWANYYRHIVSSRVFTSVDYAIFDAMVRWMRRRHPRKGLWWLRARYGRSAGHRHWIITAATWKADGSGSYSDLFQASSVPIRRHVKVQQAATAFDPAFREYFQKLRKSRTQAKAAEQVGSFRASAALRRSRQPRPGRVTAAPRKA